MAITIAITSGSGYFGSVYTQTGGGAGQWYADATPIAGATGNTYTMESANEGKAITYRQTSPALTSNQIKMWTPQASGLANLLCDFDASLASTITHTAGVTDSIASRVGVWQLQQTTAADKPTYSATGRNGLPAISGDGTSDHFNIVPGAGPAIPVGTTPSTVLAMAFYGNFTGDNWRALMMWGSGASATNAGRNLYKSSGEFVASGGSSAEDCITAVSWPNTDRLVAFEYTSTGKRIFVDGNTTPTVKALALNTGAATLARVFRGTTDYWRGSFQEIIVFAAALADADRQKAEGYLAHKWGKTASLPAGHPYKTAAPQLTVTATAAVSGLLPTAGVLMQENSTDPITISVTSGDGYFGSVYTRTPTVFGQWYAGATAIPGATNATYTLESIYEGRLIGFRAYDGRRSNRIQFFTPDMAPGLLADWDASRSDLMTISTGVSLMTSRSTGARTLSQATPAARPTYNATGRNSKPAIVADGVDDHLLIDGTWLPIGTDTSVIAVQAYYANISNAVWKTLIGWSSATTTRAINKNDLGNVAMGGGTSGRDILSTVAWRNADNIIVGTDLSTGKLLNVNGGATISKPNTNSTPNRNGAIIFRSGSEYWTGSFQEILIYGVELSTDHRQRVEGYLAAKWGTRSLLPGDHPYKASSPLPVVNEIIATGLLPTAAISAQIHPKFSAAVGGLLPTMAALTDTAQPGPIVISVTSGTGYAGSVYTRDSFAAGYWWVGNTRLDAETGMTLTMQAAWEGKTIQFRSSNGYRSNGIDLFVPAELFGLLAQFDAYDDPTVTRASGVVSQWSSRWGNWTFTQGTEASKPAFSATGRNSRPAITGDGTNDYMDLNTSGAGIPAGADPAHIIVAAAFVGSPVAAHRMLLKWGSVSTARRGIARSNNDLVTAMGGTVPTNNEAAGYDWDSDRIVAVDYQALGNIINVDGGTDDVLAVIQNSTDQGAAYLFRDATLYGAFAAQEILIWNRSLSASDRQKVEGYLASKWGLRGHLPGGHPYKSSNPPANQSGNAAGVGYLPTAAIQGVVPFVVYPTLNGYLPTAALLAATVADADLDLNGYLPTAAISAKMQTRVWADVNGLLPTSAGEFKMQTRATVAGMGFLPTAEIAAEFPVRVTMEITGYLPVAEIGGESVYEVDIEAMGILPTAAIDAPVFQFEITAEFNGFLPTMESVLAVTPKITLEVEGLLPTMEAELEFPVRIMADMEGYLPTTEISAGPVLKIDIELFGLLPTAEINVEPMQYIAMADVVGFLPTVEAEMEFPVRATLAVDGLLPTAAIFSGLNYELEIDLSGLLPTAGITAELFVYTATLDAVGFLPVSEIGGESIYEVTVDGFGLLPTADGEIDVPQRVDATVVGLGLLPTAEVSLSVRYIVTSGAVGYLATVEILAEPGPVEVTLNLTGYLPTGSASAGNGGEPERPAAYTPSASSTNSTLTVGGGPVLSYGSGLKVG